MLCILQIYYGIMGKLHEKKEHIEEKERIKLAVYHEDLKQEAQVLRTQLKQVSCTQSYRDLSCNLLWLHVIVINIPL